MTCNVKHLFSSLHTPTLFRTSISPGAMKRKRETKTDGGEICKLGSEWTAKRRPPSRDEKGLTTLGYKFMSSRPSARKSRLSLPKFHTNGNLRTPSEQQTHENEEDDTEGDWISQLGAKYMTRKKLYEARGVPLFDCSAHFSPREHELELDNELDNAWIADFGMQWMKRRCRTRRGQYKVHDDAWICELGFQWMNRAREREHANQTWLSDLSSQYMTRRKRELDRGIEELGLTAYRSFLERKDNCDSLWETRRKLQYLDPDSEFNMKRSKNGNGPDFEDDNHEVDAPENGQTGVVDGVNASEAGVAHKINEAGTVDGVNNSEAGVAHKINEAGTVDGVNASEAGAAHKIIEPGGEHRPNHLEQVAKLIGDTETSCRLLLPQVVDSEFELPDREEVDASDEFQVLEFDPLGDLDPTEYVNLDDHDSRSSSS